MKGFAQLIHQPLGYDPRSYSVSALAIYHAQVSGFRDQGTEIWARENIN